MWNARAATAKGTAMGRLAERRARVAPRTITAIGRADADPASHGRSGADELPGLAWFHRTARYGLHRHARAAQAARTAVACFRSWLAAEGWHEIEVDGALRVRRATRCGLVLLGAAVDAHALRPGTGLPTELASWLRRTETGAPTGAARTVLRGCRQLTLRALPAIDGDGWLVFVAERDAPSAATAGFALPAVAPLSPREREVLDWVAAGKTDAQAAAILGISVRTVQKHLENAYVKLGVEGRTAAVMRVRGGAIGR